MMLDEVLEYLNWWKYPTLGKYVKGIETGKFKITDGIIKPVSIAENQYFRVVGSLFNDGVYCNAGLTLIDEEFEGEVWLLAIPNTLLDIVAEVETWQKKSGEPSPYQSESFNGYSYSRASSANGGQMTWQDAFSNRLRAWRKL